MGTGVHAYMHVILFFFALLLTVLLVPCAMFIAYHFNIVDAPDGKLKVHTKTTPYLGGCAIFCGFIFPIGALYLGTSYALFFKAWIFFFVGLFLLLLIGLADDILQFRPLTKLLGQAAATFFLLLFLIVAGPVWINQTLFHISGVYIWLLSVINAFNLIDVMDGLATVTAITIALQLIALAYLQQNILLVMCLASFVGALCSFLWYNKPEARIYMGDSGSLFIGGFLATAVMLIGWNSFSWICVGPIYIFFIPLFELSALICIRYFKGIPFYQGSPDHFSHYLQRQHWQKEDILKYIVIVTALSTFLLLFFWNNGISPWPVTIFPLIAVLPIICIICKTNNIKICCFLKKSSFF